MALVARARNTDEANALVDRDGICVIEGVLDAAALERVRAALKAGIASAEAKGVPVRAFPFDPDLRNIRLFDLIGKDPVFSELVEYPLAVEIVRHVISS